MAYDPGVNEDGLPDFNLSSDDETLIGNIASSFPMVSLTPSPSVSAASTANALSNPWIWGIGAALLLAVVLGASGD